MRAGDTINTEGVPPLTNTLLITSLRMVSVKVRVVPSVRTDTPIVVGSTPWVVPADLFVFVLMKDNNELILRAVEPDVPAA